jgi:hypothetical protein
MAHCAVPYGFTGLISFYYRLCGTEASKSGTNVIMIAPMNAPKLVDADLVCSVHCAFRITMCGNWHLLHEDAESSCHHRAVLSQLGFSQNPCSKLPQAPPCPSPLKPSGFSAVHAAPRWRSKGPRGSKKDRKRQKKTKKDKRQKKTKKDKKDKAGVTQDGPTSGQQG